MVNLRHRRRKRQRRRRNIPVGRRVFAEGDRPPMMSDDYPDTRRAARDVEREAREFLEYQLLPLHALVARLEDGFAPTFSRRLARPDGAPAAHLDDLAAADPELHAAVLRLRRSVPFRLRFAWAELRRRGRLPG
jgi:hypothetical protein